MVLWEKLAFKEILWEEASPVLRADSQFRFMGVMANLKDIKGSGGQNEEVLE